MSALVEKLSGALLERGWMMTAAESCTGGQIAAAITSKPGSSNVFDRGFVTYSNDAKIEMLGVDQSIIENHGAVSEECARAMAEGALHHSKAQIAISTTGIAGPDGGSADKPVGLVWFGLSADGAQTMTFQNIFDGDRAAVQKQAVETALHRMLQYLEGVRV